MENINELDLRELLKAKHSSQELNGKLVRRLLDTSISWEEKRVLWHFLFNWGQKLLVVETLARALELRLRVPLDLFAELVVEAKITPSQSVATSFSKAVQKLEASQDMIVTTAWDQWDATLPLIRRQALEKKIQSLRAQKDQMLEKFHFLRNQRMNDQAGRLLKRLFELYPDDPEIQSYRAEFEEEWAREVIANHLSQIDQRQHRFDRTLTAPSGLDAEMLKSFLQEGEKIVATDRDFAMNLAIAFWFLEDHQSGLEILNWAAPSHSVDWLRAEMLFESRRYLEAIEQCEKIELHNSADSETTFAVIYLRAQCLFELGQQASALEMMESIARVRPNYRSAHALILKWTSGVQHE